MPTSPLRLLSLCLVVSLALSACPDPTQHSEGPGGAPPAGGAPGGPGGPGAAGPPAGGSQAGTGSGRPDDARFKVSEGEGVMLSGTYSYSGDKTGSYRIDFLQLAEGAPPLLLHALTLDAPGPWKVEAPKDFGDVYIVAFLDEDKDGPSPKDPAARIAGAVTIASQPVTGLDLVLTESADLGNLAPAGGAPPPGNGPPPAEGGQAGGAEPDGAASAPAPATASPEVPAAPPVTE